MGLQRKGYDGAKSQAMQVAITKSEGTQSRVSLEPPRSSTLLTFPFWLSDTDFKILLLRLTIARIC